MTTERERDIQMLRQLQKPATERSFSDLITRMPRFITKLKRPSARIIVNSNPGLIPPTNLNHSSAMAGFNQQLAALTKRYQELSDEVLVAKANDKRRQKK